MLSQRQTFQPNEIIAKITHQESIGLKPKLHFHFMYHQWVLPKETNNWPHQLLLLLILSSTDQRSTISISKFVLHLHSWREGKEGWKEGGDGERERGGEAVDKAVKRRDEEDEMRKQRVGDKRGGSQQDFAWQLFFNPHYLTQELGLT